MAVSISLASAVLNATLGEAVLYGVYVALFPIAMFLLLTRSRTKVNICLTAVTLLMFMLSSAHIVMLLQYANTAYMKKDIAQEGETILHLEGDPAIYVPIALEVINCYVADAIVFWRAWVLWGKTWKSLAIPLVLWLTSVAGGTGSIVALAVVTPTSSASITSVAILTLAFAVITCFSNVWAVGMIGYRYYTYHKEVVAVLGRRKANYRTLLVLIIESGVLYCLSWLSLITVYLYGNQALYLILFQLVAQLTGIYPTMIIVIVCLRLTQQDDIDRFYSSVRGLSSSASVPSSLHITREPAPNVEVSIAYSPASGVEEIRGVEGADAITELAELDGIPPGSVYRKYSSPV